MATKPNPDVSALARKALAGAKNKVISDKPRRLPKTIGDVWKLDYDKFYKDKSFEILDMSEETSHEEE